MRKNLLPTAGAVTVLLALAGCAQTSENKDEPKGARVVQEAPLGSRIKRKGQQAPVESFNKTQVDQMRLQQGIQQTSEFQKAGR